MYVFILSSFSSSCSRRSFCGIDFFFKVCFSFFFFRFQLIINLLVLQNNFYLSIFNGRKNWIDLLITNISHEDEKREREKFALFLGFGNATTIFPKLFYKIL
jgi:hypothetical protein